MKRRGLTRLQTARILGISPRMVDWYINGGYEVPRGVGLLMLALDEGALRPEWLEQCPLPVHRPGRKRAAVSAA